MNAKNKLVFLSIAALVLMSLTSSSVLGANVINDLFSSLFGEGNDILDIGQLYENYHTIIDFVLLVILFIAVSRFAFKGRFGETGSAKTLAVVIGIILAIGAVWWMDNEGMKLGDFGKIGALVIVGLIGLAVYYLITAFGGGSHRSLAAAASYIFVYYTIGAVAPFVFDYIKENVSLVYVVLQVLLIVSLVYVAIGLWGLFRDIFKLRATDNLTFGDAGRKGLQYSGKGAALAGEGAARLAGAGSKRGADAAKATAEKIRESMDKAAQERRIARTLRGVEVKGEKDAKRIRQFLEGIIKQLKQKKQIGNEIIRKFNDVVPSNAQEIQRDLQMIKDLVAQLERLEYEELKNVRSAVDALLSQAEPHPPIRLTSIEKEVKMIEDDLKGEFMETRNELAQYTQRIDTEAHQFTEEVRVGSNIIAGVNSAIDSGRFDAADIRQRMETAQKNFEAATAMLKEMEDNFRRAKQVARMVDSINNAKARLERHVGKSVSEIIRTAGP